MRQRRAPKAKQFGQGMCFFFAFVGQRWAPRTIILFVQWVAFVRQRPELKANLAQDCASFVLGGQRWALRVDQFGQGVVFLLCFGAEKAPRVNRTSGNSIASILGEPKCMATKYETFLPRIQFLWSCRKEVGTKSESIWQTWVSLSFFGAPEEATRANQFPFTVQMSFFTGQRWATRVNQFVIQLSFCHGAEVGTRSELIRNTIEFPSWDRDGHQEFLSRDKSRHQNESVCLHITFFSWRRGGPKGETDCLGLEFLS